MVFRRRGLPALAPQRVPAIPKSNEPRTSPRAVPAFGAVSCCAGVAGLFIGLVFNPLAG